MSWYLANDDGNLLDQFASISGLRDLRLASESKPALKEFFAQGSTSDVAACIEQLGQVTGSADVKNTAAGLAKLMKGQKSVHITQGIS